MKKLIQNTKPIFAKNMFLNSLKILCFTLLFLLITTSKLLGQQATEAQKQKFINWSNQSFKLLASDKQKAETSTTVEINEEIVTSFKSVSYSCGGAIFSISRGIETYLNDSLFLFISKAKRTLSILPTEKGKDYLLSNKNKVITEVKDSITYERKKSLIVFTLFPKNEQINNTEYHFTSEGMIKKMVIKQNSPQGTITTTVNYSLTKLTKNEFIWTESTFIKKQNGVTMPSEKYKNYNLLDLR